MATIDLNGRLLAGAPALEDPMATAPRFQFSRALAAVLLCLPWLMPFAPGPSPNAVPWMASAVCALGILVLLPSARIPLGRLLLVALALLYIVLHPAQGAIDRAALVGAAALIAIGFSVGRGAAGTPTVSLIAGTWLVAALLSSVLALLQYFDLAAALHPWVYVGKAGEAVADLRQRNQLATLTSIGFAACVWFAATTRRRLALYCGASLLLAFANAATTSRTGLVQWTAITVLLLIWRSPVRGRALRVCGCGVAAYALASWMLPPLLERYTGTAADSMVGRLAADLGCSSRRVLWRDVLALIAERPWFGWGWGELDYAHFTHLYGNVPRFCDILDNAHNLVLHVAVEVGVPAAVALCVVVGAWLMRMRPWRKSGHEQQLAIMVLTVLALHSLVEYPLWYGPFQIALGLAWGLTRSADSLAATSLRGRQRAAIAAFGLAFIAYASWDYARVTQIYLQPEERRAAWRDNTLEQARKSWLFGNHAKFAELTLTTPTAANAATVHQLALDMLHYSPEPRVIERLIESATLLGRNDEAVLALARYRAAFPQDYARWRANTNSPAAATGASGPVERLP